jgi:chromosome partitioning protein
MSQAAMNGANVPHVIVVGNEKGGSGKTTIAIHVVVALLQAGQRVAAIDLDSRQKSLTRYIENRRYWARRTGLQLPVPDHFTIPRAVGLRLDDNERADFAAFEKAVMATVEAGHDFLVIDTPPSDCYLMRLAHSMTDTLITPLNDSFLDIDVIANVDPVTFSVTHISHYGEMVREARRYRRLVDGVLNDWVVVPNRLPEAPSPNKRIAEALKELSLSLAFRIGSGLAELSAYREWVPRGLTALDETAAPSLVPGSGGDHAHHEVVQLIGALRLPLNERNRRRSAIRAEWFATSGQLLEVDEILAPLSAEGLRP